MEGEPRTAATFQEGVVGAVYSGDWAGYAAGMSKRSYTQLPKVFRRSALVVAVAAFLIGCRGHQSDFRSVRFGMTPVEVKAAENLTHVGEESNSHITYERVLTETLPGKPRLTTLTYDFVDSKLVSACYALNAIGERIPSPELRRDYDSLAEHFTRTLGVEAEGKHRILSTTVGRDDYDFFAVWGPVNRPAVGLRLETDASTSLGLPYDYRVCFARDRDLLGRMAE